MEHVKKEKKQLIDSLMNKMCVGHTCHSVLLFFDYWHEKLYEMRSAYIFILLQNMFDRPSNKTKSLTAAGNRNFPEIPFGICFSLVKHSRMRTAPYPSRMDWQQLCVCHCHAHHCLPCRRHSQPLLTRMMLIRLTVVPSLPSNHFVPFAAVAVCCCCCFVVLRCRPTPSATSAHRMGQSRRFLRHSHSLLLLIR